MSLETVCSVVADIDVAAEVNRSPKQKLGTGEVCDVVRLPVSHLTRCLREMSARGEAIIDACLWHLAQGLELRPVQQGGELLGPPALL
jgi:hypothetical protein